LLSLRLFLSTARRLLLPQLGPAALFAWLLIVLASPQLLLHSASLDQLLESAKRHSDRFSVMDTHS
jgi:hypothetical protein